MTRPRLRRLVPRPVLRALLRFLEVDPPEPRAGETRAMLIKLEDSVTPWTAYLIVPLFALANAGLSFDHGALGITPVALGVGTGLLLGKTAGIFTFTWLSVRTRIARLPTGVTFGHVLGISALGGVGFTVSLFVAGLAFEDPRLLNEAKVGIFAGSVLAAALGFTILRHAIQER